MISIIKEITLEVSKPNLFQAITAKQGDYDSRFLKAKFVCEGSEIAIARDSSVIINALRMSDGKSNSFDGEVNEDNTVLVPLHEWILTFEGLVQCDVSIINGDKKLTSTSFLVNVEKAANADNTSYSEELYTEIQKLQNECEATMTAIKSSTAKTGDLANGEVVTVSYDDKTGLEFLFDTEKISGKDGVGIKSVVQTTTSTEDDGENIITVTNTDNTENTFKVKNGSKGTDGVSATHFWDGTNLTITSASGTSSADLKGDKGDKGDAFSQEVMAPVNVYLEDDDYFVNFNLDFTTYNGLLYVRMRIEDVTIGASWCASSTTLFSGWTPPAFANMIDKAKSAFTNTPSLWSGEVYIKGTLHVYVEVNLPDLTVSVTVTEYNGDTVYVDDGICFDLVLTPKVI